MTFHKEFLLFLSYIISQFFSALGFNIIFIYFELTSKKMNLQVPFREIIVPYHNIAILDYFYPRIMLKIRIMEMAAQMVL
jgi:hypothetical protein